MSCVIVGAGVAGTTLALKLLAKKRQFVLVNPKDYFHLNFAAVRAVAIPGWAEKSLIPLSPVFGAAYKMGNVTNIVPSVPEGKVVLESGEEVAYQYLVLATGTTHKWPVKIVDMEKEDVFSEYKKLVDRVKNAKSIVVAGGGATGVETAAELKRFHPDTEVTLVHSNDHLVSNKLSDKSQLQLQNTLKTDFDINLILGERVSNLKDLPITGPGVVKTDKGTSIQADVVFKFIGLKINTEPFKGALSSAMTETGALKVDKYFHVEGFKNIYAIGDCANIDEPKIGVLAIKHGEHVAQSILNLDQGKPEAEYKPDSFPILVGISLGPDNGFGRTKSDWRLPVFMMKKIKAKYLFTTKWWGDMKQGSPPEINSE